MLRVAYFVIEVALFAWLGYIFATQVVYPLWAGTKLFPSFRGENKKLTSEEIDIQSRLETKRRRKELEELRSRLKIKEEKKE